VGRGTIVHHANKRWGDGSDQHMNHWCSTPCIWAKKIYFRSSIIEFL